MMALFEPIARGLPTERDVLFLLLDSYSLLWFLCELRRKKQAKRLPSSGRRRQVESG